MYTTKNDLIKKAFQILDIQIEDSSSYNYRATMKLNTMFRKLNSALFKEVLEIQKNIQRIKDINKRIEVKKEIRQKVESLLQEDFALSRGTKRKRKPRKIELAKLLEDIDKSNEREKARKAKRVSFRAI